MVVPWTPSKVPKDTRRTVGPPFVLVVGLRTCWRAFLFAEGFLEATTNVYGLTLANRGAQRRTRPALFLVEGWGTRPQQRGRSFHDFPRCGLETAGFTVMSQLLKKRSHACGAKGRRRTPFPACRFLWSFRLQQRNRDVAL